MDIRSVRKYMTGDWMDDWSNKMGIQFSDNSDLDETPQDKIKETLSENLTMYEELFWY